MSAPPFLDFEKWLADGEVRKVTVGSYGKRNCLLSKVGSAEESDRIRIIICTSAVTEGMIDR